MLAAQPHDHLRPAPPPRHSPLSRCLLHHHRALTIATPFSSTASPTSTPRRARLQHLHLLLFPPLPAFIPQTLPLPLFVELPHAELVAAQVPADQPNSELPFALNLRPDHLLPPSVVAVLSSPSETIDAMLSLQAPLKELPAVAEFTPSPS
ncbi:uncharacterized protein A4U43_C04F9750 [Asparagus officinalis]|uniref:Uncharacterized protein n=1 Tax=Asparagus officinalis TaxID=4686 RepID=A0A5P1EZL8_ASPOF|nr:uncharacterized protein A4U43_C04F9750 [Asparagus officinalis]